MRCTVDGRPAGVEAGAAWVALTGGVRSRASRSRGGCSPGARCVPPGRSPSASRDLQPLRGPRVVVDARVPSIVATVGQRGLPQRDALQVGLISAVIDAVGDVGTEV